MMELYVAAFFIGMTVGILVTAGLAVYFLMPPR